jgi:hypothetical protein
MYNQLINPSPATQTNIQVGATNLRIELEIREGYAPLSISTATVKNIIIKKPDDTLMTKSGTFLTDGTDGRIYYMTSGSDLNMAGTYGVQAYISMPDFTGYSTPTEFSVDANL